MEYQILRSQIKGDDDDHACIGKKKVCFYLFSLCNCFSQVSLRRDIGHKIKEMKDKLDVIAIEKDKYHLIDSGKAEEPPRQMASSVIDVLEVCGRTLDKDIIVSKLLSKSSRQEIDVPVISIHGMAGIGKTTLAQIVFNDDKVKTYFEKRMWVCVSEPFDKIRIAKAIIEAISGNVPNVIEWETLHQHLGDSVKGKQFLLVLDDVWTEDHAMWSPLKLSLNGGAQGSRIVVTTQNERVAMMMGSTYIHNLGQLSKEDCWLLISCIAFKGRREEECEKLEEIGKKIANKCKGVPLFAKTLGSLLLFKRTRQEWQDVLESDTWELPEVEKGVLPVPFLSYNDLPSHLKRCFTYCSIFPKDSKIYKYDLIKLWMAQGLLSSKGRRELEAVGAEYFNNLVMRLCFQNMERDNGGNIIFGKMHDLFHDFAQVLTDNECSIINGMDLRFNISSKVRHLYAHNMDLDSTLPSIYKAKKLRTLILHGWVSECFPALSDLFSRLTCLRALSLMGVLNLEELPNEVEKLIHLRYFDLSMTDLKELPETMSKLYNLQTLKLNDCGSLFKLPQGIGNMISLRHLEIERTDELCYLPQGIGRLSSLRTLCKFIVGDLNGGGCKVGELKDLNLLRGDLVIMGLEEVADVNEANEANLKNKQHLLSLTLDFEDCALEDEEEDEREGDYELGDEAEDEREGDYELGDEEEDHVEGDCELGNEEKGEIERIEGVLEGLQPHRNLEKLKIQSYPGSKFPSWITDSLLSNLLTVELVDCYKCVHFPALGKFPFLQELVIGLMDEVIKFRIKEFGETVGSDGLVTFFPRLKKFVIYSMDNLEELDLRVEDEEIIMPCLSHLELEGIPKLKVLPALGNLPALESLCIDRMGLVKHVGFEFIGIDGTKREGGESRAVVAFPHLKELKLRDMSEWEMLELAREDDAAGGGDVFMPRLCKLHLSMCPKLEKLPHHIIISGTLRELYIKDCPKLTWTSCSLPPRLEKLTLDGDTGVLSRSLPTHHTHCSNHLKSLAISSSIHSSLPQGLAHLTNLQSLLINFSDSLTCMSEELRHLVSLRDLDIRWCSILEQRCKKEIGEDWSIISRIPNITIGSEQIQ